MFVYKRVETSRFSPYLPPSFFQCNIGFYYFPQHFSNKTQGDEETTKKFNESVAQYLEKLKDELNISENLYVHCQLLSTEQDPIGFPFYYMKFEHLKDIIGSTILKEYQYLTSTKGEHFDEFLFNLLMNGGLEIRLIYVQDPQLLETLHQYMSSKKDSEPFDEQIDEMLRIRYCLKNKILLYDEFIV